MIEIKDTLIATDLDGTYLYPKHRFKLLSRGYTKFSKRFKGVEQRLKERGREMKECTLAELDAIWEEVKKEQREQV